MKSEHILDIADWYAKSETGCLKVSVGCAIVREHTMLHTIGYITDYKVISLGANRSLPDCKKEGICNRVKLYGEDSKAHRLPSDCNAIHSEIDAIINAKQNISGCSAFITRYPCEACARALVKAGITRIVYGRQQEISEATKDILKDVEVVHINWYREDVVR